MMVSIFVVCAYIVYRTYLYAEVFLSSPGCPNDAMDEYNLVRFHTVDHGDTTLDGRKEISVCIVKYYDP
jgi:hypothetical protein